MWVTHTADYVLNSKKRIVRNLVLNVIYRIESTKSINYEGERISIFSLRIAYFAYKREKPDRQDFDEFIATFEHRQFKSKAFRKLE